MYNSHDMALRNMLVHEVSAQPHMQHPHYKWLDARGQEDNYITTKQSTVSAVFLLFTLTTALAVSLILVLQDQVPLQKVPQYSPHYLCHQCSYHKEAKSL